MTLNMPPGIPGRAICRRRVAVVCAIVAPLLVACTGPASSSTPTSVDPATAGHLVGVVYASGGALTGGEGSSPVQKAPWPYANATVIATPTDGAQREDRSTHTAGDGSFRIDLSPGAYGVAAVGQIGDEHPPARMVTVAAGETVSVDLYLLPFP